MKSFLALRATPGIGRLAMLAAMIGPVQAVLGWIISGALWPGFDHVRSTISDLAANDSPVKWVQSSFFVLGGTLSLIVAWQARSFAMPGRIVIFLSGLTTYGLTIFATPTQETSSVWHRVFAIATFILMSAWPLFSFRRADVVPWPLRPWGAIAAMIVFTVGSFAFLAVWRDPTQPAIGLWERVMAESQVVYLSLVIVLAWRFERSREAVVKS
jgi:hypothetical membrane protein